MPDLKKSHANFFRTHLIEMGPRPVTPNLTLSTLHIHVIPKVGLHNAVLLFSS